MTEKFIICFEICASFEFRISKKFKNFEKLRKFISKNDTKHHTDFKSLFSIQNLWFLWREIWITTL